MPLRLLVAMLLNCLFAVCFVVIFYEPSTFLNLSIAAISSQKSCILARDNFDDFRRPNGSLNSVAMFIHKVLLDSRDPNGTRIRIFANMKCSLQPTAVQAQIGDSLRLSFVSRTIIAYSGCDSKCDFNNGVIDSQYFSGTNAEEVQIWLNGQHVSMRLERVSEQNIEGFNSCLNAPLFWFNDWPRLFLFIEWWKRLGVRKILINLHSISKETKQLLDYYVKKGVVVVRALPRMPFSDDYDTNSELYYANNHAAVFYCSVWSDSQYTAMNDIDELFVVRRRNASMLDILKQEFTPDIGQLLLPHFGIWMEQPLVPRPWNYEKFTTFASLRTATVVSNRRMHKYFYRTRDVRVPWVHNVKQFFAPRETKEVSTDVAVYLHFRFDMPKPEQNETLFPDFSLFGTEDEQMALRSVLHEIFSDETPSCNFYAVREQSEASMNKNAEDKGCISTSGIFLQSKMKNTDDWFYAVASEESQFVPL